MKRLAAAVLTTLAITASCDNAGEAMGEGPRYVPTPVQSVELVPTEMDWTLDRLEAEREAVFRKLRVELAKYEPDFSVEAVIATLKGTDNDMILTTGTEEGSRLVARAYALGARIEQLAR